MSNDRLRFMVFATGMFLAAAGCGGEATSGTGGSGGTTGSGGTGGTGGQTSTGGTGTGGTGTGGVTTTGGGGTGGAGACAGYEGQASLAEIAASPFPNKEAEILAIEASGALVGPKHVYDRVLADLQAIRAANPVLQNVAAMPSWTADELLVGFDAAGLAAVQAGTYAGWDCANAWYGVTSYDAGSTYALVQFGHRFHIDLLGQEYAMFPNVTSAEPNGFVGDGNDVCVSIANDKTYSYVFDQGSGDCPAGCINHDYKGFQTDGQPGGITSLGAFSNQNPAPAWFTALSACTKWL